MENQKVLKIIEKDDETYEIYIDGSKIHTLSYQELGWEGLYDAIDAVKSVAKNLGADVQIEADNL